MTPTECSIPWCSDDVTTCYCSSYTSLQPVTQCKPAFTYNNRLYFSRFYQELMRPHQQSLLYSTAFGVRQMTIALTAVFEYLIHSKVVLHQARYMAFPPLLNNLFMTPISRSRVSSPPPIYHRSTHFAGGYCTNSSYLFVSIYLGCMC